MYKNKHICELFQLIAKMLLYHVLLKKKKKHCSALQPNTHAEIKLSVTESWNEMQFVIEYSYYFPLFHQYLTQEIKKPTP